jgi:hypothetical protein
MYYIKFNIDEWDKNAILDIFKFYPSRRMKFSHEVTTDDIKAYREFEMIDQIQKDLKTLNLKSNTNTDTGKKNYMDENIDMPIISDIPFKSKYEIDLYDELDTNNTSYECDLPFVNYENKITEKIIDNAIKTEKTIMRYFDSLNLQPNNR